MGLREPGGPGFPPVLNGSLNSLSAEVPVSNSFAALASVEEEVDATGPPVPPPPVAVAPRTCRRADCSSARCQPRGPAPTPRTLGAFIDGATHRPARALHGCRNPSTARLVGSARTPVGAGLASLTVEGRPEEPRLCSLDQTKAGWRSVTAVVDSGAEETVAPPGLLPGRVEESPMQRAGGRYRAANGSRLPNLGQQVAAFRTTEGLARSLRFQIAGVERPLISVAQLARTGHRVEFGADGGAHSACAQRPEAPAPARRWCVSAQDDGQGSGIWCQQPFRPVHCTVAAIHCH